jgi:hypothetical protein
MQNPEIIVFMVSKVAAQISARKQNHKLMVLFTGTDLRRNFQNHKNRIGGPEHGFYGSLFFGRC